MIATLSRNPKTLWLMSLVLGIATILIAAALLLGTFWGDPVIYLPYARNNAAGDFFAYNPGVFSSGATSPLWSLILSLPYLVGADVIGAKITSILATVGAFFVLASMSARLNGRSAGSGIALLYAVEMLTLVGLMMYESPLIVACVALSLIAGDRLVERWEHSGSLTWRSLWFVAVVWAMLPLARPEAALLVPLQIAAMWFAGPQRGARTLLVLIASAVVAAIPALMYFGYSYVTVGSVSVSSECRSFALMESADRVGPIVLSRVALAYVGSILFAIAIAVFGFDSFRLERRTRWIGIYAALSIALYIVLLVFVQPVTNDLPRYFLPIAPFIVLGVGRALTRGEAMLANAHYGWLLSAIFVVLVFVVRPPLVVLGEAVDQSRRGYTFGEIVEREVVGHINRIATPGQTVLAYEVQARYDLRRDVSLLSLDGITDGLVAPYLVSADMASFIKRYRPDYWIANNAGSYRPYLQRSVLQRAINALAKPTDATKSDSRTFTESGITFELLERRDRPMPRGFAGWTMLVRLSYDSSLADARPMLDDRAFEKRRRSQ